MRNTLRNILAAAIVACALALAVPAFAADFTITVGGSISMSCHGFAGTQDITSTGGCPTVTVGPGSIISTTASQGGSNFSFSVNGLAVGSSTIQATFTNPAGSAQTQTYTVQVTAPAPTSATLTSP